MVPSAGDYQRVMQRFEESIARGRRVISAVCSQTPPPVFQDSIARRQSVKTPPLPAAIYERFTRNFQESTFRDQRVISTVYRQTPPPPPQVFLDSIARKQSRRISSPVSLEKVASMNDAVYREVIENKILNYLSKM
jgi:hypothetical protein